jgi:hypothetical protein
VQEGCNHAAGWRPIGHGFLAEVGAGRAKLLPSRIPAAIVKMLAGDQNADQRAGARQEPRLPKRDALVQRLSEGFNASGLLRGGSWGLGLEVAFAAGFRGAEYGVC